MKARGEIKEADSAVSKTACKVAIGESETAAY
jgi:hypothetical protein